MKSSLRRAVGIIMVLIMAAAALSGGCAGTGWGGNTQVSESAELEIVLRNTGFKWGDPIVFGITVKNVSEEKLTGVGIEQSVGGMGNVGAPQITPESVAQLLPGESAEFVVEYPTAEALFGGSDPVSIACTVNKGSSLFTGIVYEASVAAGNSNIKFMFRPVYGQGGGTPAQPTAEPMPAATEPPSSNDRFSFLSLTSDISDVHVGETAPVTFFAEMMSEYILSESVSLVSERDGSVLGQLRDDGVGPDAFANDGIFSGTFDLSSDARMNNSYRATCADIASRPVDICFFNDLTSADFNAVNDIFASVESIGTFDGVSEFLQENAEIEYSIEDEASGTITFTTNAGITCVWEQERPSGMRSAGFASAESIDAAVIHRAALLAESAPTSTADNKDIAVIRPFRATDFTNDDFLDCANGITAVLGGNVTCYDNGNATVDAMKHLDRYGMVLFDTHGTYVMKKNGSGSAATPVPYILIGEKIGGIAAGLYYADLQSGRIIVTSRGNAAIGPKFFEHYYADGAFDDTVFYNAACFVSINDSMNEVLVRKGASVVFGFTEAAGMTYTNNCLDEILLQSMAKGAATAREAFDSAVAKYGAIDPGNSSDSITIYGDGGYRIAVANGRIAGVVTSNSSGDPVKRATIQVFDANGTLVKQFKSDAEDGSFSAKLPAGVYSVKVFAYGYLIRAVGNVIVNPGETTYLSDSVMLVPEDEPVAAGYVINTFTGEYVSDAEIRFRSGHGNRTGEYFTAGGSEFMLISDESGEFYTDRLPAGYYTAEVVREGYITAYVDISCAKEAVDQPLPLTPEIAADQIRIVLTWGEYPYDLDSHLVGPEADGSGSFHIAYYNRTYSYGGTVYADLDRDDTDSYGPEQTTVYKKSSGTYSYYVHDYSNRGSSESRAMSRSGAKVVVYVGDSTRVFNVPSTSEGTLWHVFDFSFDSGTLTPVNTMGYETNPEAVGR